VPFGARQLVGIVVDEEAAAVDLTKLKDVSEVIDTEPVFDSVQLKLCYWLAGYYHHPLGEVMHTALPVKLRKGAMATALVRWVELTEQGRHALASKDVRGPKQRACLQLLADSSQPDMHIKQLFSASVVKSLVVKEWLAYVEKPLDEDLSWRQQISIGDTPRPSKEQAVALAAITRLQHQFSCFLLDGVTGSGKTEVYLQAIESVLFQGKQVLILVPEIGLTPQTVSRFEKRFGIGVGVLHSQLNDTARLEVWQQAKAGQLGLIIGTRSAIFTPMKYPGMIIVDEEHDDSFKQQDGLRYNARDLAVKRAQCEDIPLILGSATPSLESLNNALNKRYHHLHLSQRAGGAEFTRQYLHDVRDQPLQFGIGQGLLPVMKRHLDAGNQVLVFLNRRGFAPALLCHHCGQSVDCHHCDRPFTLHKLHHRLQCHQCGATRSIPKRCHHCQSTDLQPSGMGTEQLEIGLDKLFPNITKVRIDSDAVKGKGKLADLLTRIDNQEYQLLVGTQILSKGHHFPNVTLVVVLDCDGALFSADFRAAEKFAQLVTQLAGRAGRASKAGEMYLQTYNPAHPLLQDLIQNGFAHFSRHALLERKMAFLPPYSVQAVFKAEAVNGGMAFDFLNQLSRSLGQGEQVKTIGPVPGLIEKRQGRFRFLLVLQAPQRRILHEWVHRALVIIDTLPLATKVRWSLDVDPMDFS
jgi:primosomal protein N' (replication factor Y)